MKSYYVDEFNEPTTKGYITNKEWIKGSFSNSATQDSKLNVRFLISESSKIAIKLFEYAGNNPVKASSRGTKYRVLIQDNEGNRNSLKAVNYSDRLVFDEDNSLIIHNALLKGGMLMSIKI